MNKRIERISIQEIRGFRLGTAESTEGATGVTAILCEDGATAGVDVRGGAPATRETDLLKPENMVQKIHAVCLSGGSAFGLEADCGVMDYLAEHKIGFDTGYGIVPIVCGASLFDIHLGEQGVYPDKAMGRLAAENAFAGHFQTGNHGAGTGASVGKYKGPATSMKTGQGQYALQIGDLQVGAISAVNALGDIIGADDSLLAGMTTEGGQALCSTAETMLTDLAGIGAGFKGNTTITCIITNCKLTKAQCTKLASIAHDGYARAIKPVHTSADGDTVFVMTTGELDLNFDTAAGLATECVTEAIRDAARTAVPAYGLPAACTYGENLGM